MPRETRKDRSDSDLRETLDHSTTDTRSGEGPLAERLLPVKLGRYQVTRLLGRGGMGSVYLARDEQLDRDVALKVPKFDLKENSRARERFYREARAAAKITHPNLCPIYDVSEIDGIHCIAMAYIKGR
ncbi:MAG: protein kinase, partial [Planctomycetota bacterium]